MSTVPLWTGGYVTTRDTENLRRWVAAWDGAGRELERLRTEDIRRTDTAHAIRAFEGMMKMVLALHPPAPDSGLVAQQRFFSRMRHE